MDAQLICHIVQRSLWEQASSSGSYQSDSWDSEGFIHCSALEQVCRVADLHFRGQTGLVLLLIEPARVLPEIRYEAPHGEERFPHIYGPLNIDAVVRVVAFAPGDDGRFHLPPEVAAARR